jgi:aryl-alcohol dehydrogenase-like predicted oxidoreductase/Pyruvate/2-oxoacid:ferredoxin oxidoreductase delta subunit
MEKIRLGKTELMVTKTSFGALPIQRASIEEAKTILRAAYDAGINFFDTAHGYSDSEEKIGRSLSDVRHNIIIATKTHGKTKEEALQDIETGLKRLKTDYIDIMQLHNPTEMFDLNDPTGPYAALAEAKKKGLVRHIGVSCHRMDAAEKFIECGAFETLQYPFSPLSNEKDIAIVKRCKAHDMGFIAMKALSGGLLTNVKLIHAFMRQFDNAVPIYGIQRLWELEEFLAIDGSPVAYTPEELKEAVAKEKAELGGNFCRGCGYCMPCPQGIPINFSARMKLLLLRAPYKSFITRDWQDKMSLIEKCTDCGSCKTKCPYGLDCPALLKNELTFYKNFVEEHRSELIPE